MNRIKGLSRTGRVLIAVAVAAGAFGIVSAVQASVPDSNGVIHMCFIPLGTFTNTDKLTYLRALDTAKVPSCAAWEQEVDAASPQFVQNQIAASTASYYSSAGNVNSNGGTGVTITSVTVPAGNYQVSATGWMASLIAGGITARCYIDTPHGNANDTFSSVAGVNFPGVAPSQESWAVHLNVSRPFGGTLSVGCLDSAAPGDAQYGAQLTATRVGNLFGATFAPAQGPANAKSTP